MQGHVCKRSKNSWTVVVNLGRDPATAKRRQLWRSVRGPKKEAEALLARLLHERDTGLDVQPGRLTAGQFLERWLEDYARPNTAPKTFLRYSQIVQAHLLPVLGGIPLAKLRPLHIQGAYAGVLGKGLSARTALHCHRVLREALQHAVRWQLLARNPADGVDPPRPERLEAATPGPEDLQRVLEAAKQSPYATLIHLAVMTGLRQGELLGLRWQDVDLGASILYVRQTAQRLPGKGIVFRPPKTHRSARPVALSPATMELLREQRWQQLRDKHLAGPSYHDQGLVFSTALGMPVDPGNLRRAWQRIARAAGLRGLRFHDLRHAHATLLLQQGVHPKIVSERLGHAGVAITLDTYSHVLPNIQAQAIADLDRLLGLAEAGG